MPNTRDRFQPIGRLGWARVAAAALAVVLVVPAGGAAAEGPAAEAAMGALKLARHHYGKGEYKRAAALFHQAFELNPLADFLYNAARAEQRAFELDLAERDFKRLLQLPDASAEVQRRSKLHLAEIAESRGAMARREKEVRARLAKDSAAQADDAKLAAVAVPKRSDGVGWQAPTGWALSGLGAVTLGAAAWLAVSAVSDQDALDKRTAKDAYGLIRGISLADYQARKTGIDGQIDLSRILVGAGAAATVAGVWLLWRSPGKGSARLVPMAGGRGLALRLER